MLVGLSACGAGARDPVVVRVGTTAITKRSLTHWMSVLSPEHLVPDPPSYTACIAYEKTLVSQGTGVLREECSRQYQTLEARALDYLISSQWLISEAGNLGLRASDPEVERLREKHPYNSVTAGGSSADIRFGITAELASAAIRHKLIERKPASAQLVAYYRAHMRQFLVPERRYFDIDNLQSDAAARKVKREVEFGKSFSKLALHESVEQPTSTKYSHEEDEARRAIFTAKPGVLTGPILVYGDHSLFVVRRIVAATHRRFAQVRRSIEKQLAGERERKALARFIRAWRRRWIARTDCLPGYVVLKCRQYKGARATEDPFTLS